jgi:general secretion pathway protein B
MTVKPSAPAAPITSSTAVAHDPALTAAPLDTLPLAFQQSLPALHLDVHSYTHNPSDRFVVINMQRYIVGDTLKEGPRVVAITSAGVILEYQGTSFLLPRN